MPWVLKARFAIATDTTTAALISSPGVTATKEALSNFISGEIEEAIAGSPTVVAAAAAAAGNAVGAALDSSPRIPVLTDSGEYLWLVRTPSGRVLFGVRVDGVVDAPLLSAAGARLEGVGSGEYLKASVSPGGRVLEDALDRAGCVPDWVLSRWKQRMGAGIEGYDIVVVAGQSNATPDRTLPAVVDDPDPKLFRWDGSKIVPLGTVTYLGSEFAREYASATGRNVLLVDAAQGSTGFTTTTITPTPSGYQAGVGTWDRALTADTNNLYVKMVTQVLSARDHAGAGSRLVALLWSQGESDVRPVTGGPAPTQAQYAAKLDDLVGAARSAWSAPDLPVLVGSMTPEFVADANPAAIGGIHAAHVDTPRRVTRSAFSLGPRDLTVIGERVHYSAQGNRVRGERFYAALYRARLNVADSPPIPPQNLRVTRVSTVATVTWDFPPCRATAFTIEVAVNGGTWSAVSLSGAVATEATITVPAGDGIRVRAFTTNPVGVSEKTLEVAA